MDWLKHMRQRGASADQADVLPADMRQPLEGARLDAVRWRTKAMRAVAAGRPAAVKFAPDVLPPELAQPVIAALEGARTADDIRAALALPLEAVKAVSPEEAELRDALLKVLAQHRRAVLAALEAGEPVPPPPEIAPILNAALRAEYVRRLILFAAAQGIPIDPAVAAGLAEEWAGAYTPQLIKGLNETTAAAVTRIIDALRTTPGMRFDQAARMLEPIYGALRAEMIASTELTRAAAQAAQASQRYLEGYGVRRVLVWRTNNDERVCPVCAPRDGTAQGDGWDEPPPAHPRCRCMVGLERPASATKGIPRLPFEWDEAEIDLWDDDLLAGWALFDAAVKHGSHDQSTHGRRGPRGRAARAAYLAVRGAGGSHVEAREYARNVSEVFRLKQRLLDLEETATGHMSARQRTSTNAEYNRLYDEYRAARRAVSQSRWQDTGIDTGSYTDTSMLVATAKPRKKPGALPDGAKTGVHSARARRLHAAALEMDRRHSEERYWLKEDNMREEQAAHDAWRAYTTGATSIMPDVSTPATLRGRHGLAEERLRKRQQAEALELLRVPTPATFPKAIVKGGRREPVEDVEGKVAQLTRHSLDRPIEYRAIKGRAHASLRNGGAVAGIVRGQFRDGDVIAHEIGHVIEWNNPTVRQRAQDFLARRTVGESAESLRKLTNSTFYKPDEIAKPDRFAHPYTGKIYDGGITEVISMGVQYLYADAPKFAAEDPDYFQFMVDVLAH